MHRIQYTFVTGNKNKLAEVQQIIGNDINLTSAAIEDVPEIQGTPEEIAIAKCKAALRILNKPVITEDTCLCFDSLNGLPGAYIKQFLHALGHSGLNKMVEGFKQDDPDGYNKAYAMTICALGIPGEDEIKLFSGITKGKIVQARGPTNFGWDPIFEPEEGNGKTYAEMDKADKNQISHRSRAFNKLREYLLHKQ
ncbi:hypothetical protein MIR68_005424 [Amoeboaphelidium protococcarum]|nr:hypothetical protein MIR68_005424 [Amoeboaphelidium protococcarum]